MNYLIPVVIRSIDCSFPLGQGITPGPRRRARVDLGRPGREAERQCDDVRCASRDDGTRKILGAAIERESKTNT